MVTIEQTYQEMTSIESGDSREKTIIARSILSKNICILSTKPILSR